jgi:effector-binding domain-containing protein
VTITAKAKPASVDFVTVEPKLTAVVKVTASMADIPDAQRSSRRKIAAALETLDVGAVGAACTLSGCWEDGKLYMEPGVIVSKSFEPVGDVVPSTLPGGRAAHYRLVGPFDRLPGAWKELSDWVRAEGLKGAGAYEIYGEIVENPAEQVTDLYVVLG